MREKLVGGRGDFRPDSDFDPIELSKGIEVEYEHTGDRAIAKEIAKDHLTEHRDYYKELARMEAELERRPNPKPYEITLKQLGGAGRLKAMIGAKNFMHSDGGRTIRFQFPNRKRSKPNFVKITLDPTDTYTLEMGRTIKYDYKVLYKQEGLYASQLKGIIERETGLRLSLRNPERPTKKRTKYQQRHGGRMSSQTTHRVTPDHRNVILNDLDAQGFALVNSKARGAVRAMEAMVKRGEIEVVSATERPYVGTPAHYKVVYAKTRNPVESESQFKPHSPTRNVAPEDRDPSDRLPTRPAARFASSHWGVPHTKTYSAHIPGIPKDRPVVEMGKLLELWVRPRKSDPVDALKVVFPLQARCHLVFTMDMSERLYCVLPERWRKWCQEKLIHPEGQWYSINDVAEAAGGRQAEYLYSPDVQVQCLGRCTNIVYKTWKRGDDDALGGSEYIHRFSEESGYAHEPMLCVSKDGRLWLAGGSYHCHDDGITD